MRNRKNSIFSFLVVVTAVVIWKLLPKEEQVRKSGPVKTDVIVLGAGVAGISAAYRLHQNGIRFLIIEGSGEIGGRLKSGQFSGKTIEFGANWLHGHSTTTEQFRKFIAKYKLQGVEDDYRDLFARESGGKNVTRRAREFIFGYQRKLTDLCREFARCAGNRVTCPENFIDKLISIHQSQKDAVQCEAENFLFDFVEALSPLRVSPYCFANFLKKQWESGCSVKATDFFVADQRGFVHLLRSVASRFLADDDARLVLRSPVNLISYNGCTIHCKQSDNAVVVRTQSGRKYAARFAIVTFSNNVLLDRSVRFQPPIPNWKKRALRLMPTALYLKVFLDFGNQTAPIDRHAYVLLVHTGKDNVSHTGNFSIWQNLKIVPYFADSNVVLVTFTGNLAEELEKAPKSAIIAQAQEALEDIYGAPLKATIVDETHYCWTCDSFARGSYAAPLRGLSPKEEKDLGKNIGSLYFAGDGVACAHHGSISGAWETGQKAADKIIAALRKSYTTEI